MRRGLFESTRHESPALSTSNGSGGSCFLGAFTKPIADELQQRLLRTQSINPSEQQQVILDWQKNGNGSLNIIAYAGCGKSTTLLELARHTSNPIAGTIHSLGFKLWREIKPRSEVEKNKVNGIAYKLYPFDRDHPERREIAAALIEAVRLGKQACFGIDANHLAVDDEAAWMELIDYYEIDEDLPGQCSVEQLAADCALVYQRSLDMCIDDGIIDYDDMLLGPLTYGEPKRQFDWMMIDEGQDTSEGRRLIVQWCLKDGGRLVAAGDANQAIMGFSGASSDAMEIIKRDMNSAELPLSVTYRCPRRIVQLAKQWVPDFTAHPSAPEGRLEKIRHTEFWTQQLDPRRDVVLCRNIRPLIGVAKRLRKQGVVCRVRGRSASGIVKLATKWGNTGNKEMLANLDGYVEKERQKWLERGRLDKVERLEDKVFAIKETAAECGEQGTVRDTVKGLELLFGEGEYEDNALLLSSIHAYKGKEKDRVWLIGRNRYMPSRLAKTEEQRRQEANCQYVAVTRAKRELWEVEVPMASRNEVPWWEI